ncbi:SPOR domain-containing protein [Massilia sp. PAMC28688]|uniref:SPOR domain-containing protein n=1 Tax=Massilia sp. PAMC28688 TaxID=2861283 RepID=UPI001C62E25F|nr:SPOR domain-containing protein [Massilia sp. PAMC28688]QYF94544.1 SPOR domain-containing protein [Massilia sp. PAMC28688]
MTSDFRTLQRQHGNTLTGVVIGLIIGLVIAVIVALAITKGATPFTDKTGKAGKMSEATVGEAFDPNKPMYGNKDAARQANKEITARQKPSDDPLGDAVAAMGAAAPAAEATPDAPVAEASGTEASAANVTPAEAKPAPPKPAADGLDGVTYYLQAGAFREMEDAENTRAKLALLGFEASISEKPNESGVLHRVRVGPFPQLEAMNKARAKLIDSGIDVAIVKNQK